MSSQPRQNFHSDCEAGINKHINLELYARYVYQSMASHFDRDDVALRGFGKFFKEASEERNECAEKLIKYQNMRGGRVVLQIIRKPERDDWGTGLHAIQAAIELEKIANRSLLDLHNVAIGHTDPQMCDTLQSEHLEGKVEVIKKLADHITNLKRVGPGLGEFMFDKEALE